MGDFHELKQPGFLSRCSTSNCVMPMAICLFQIDVFEMDACAIKSLMLGTYIL